MSKHRPKRSDLPLIEREGVGKPPPPNTYRQAEKGKAGTLDGKDWKLRG